MNKFKFIDNSQQYLTELDRLKAIALESIGIRVEKYAKAAAPVGTPESTGIPGYRGGTLRNSITHEVELTEEVVYIGTNVEYAPYQELGTRFMAASNKGRGYLRPAIDDHLTELKEIIKKTLGGYNVV